MKEFVQDQTLSDRQVDDSALVSHGEGWWGCVHSSLGWVDKFELNIGDEYRNFQVALLRNPGRRFQLRFRRNLSFVVTISSMTSALNCKTRANRTQPKRIS